jgi:uncharacterized protein (DUF1015 family)
MAEIRPFRGVRYDQSKIKNLAEVISPPYDIISPKQQDILYKSNPYNFVRIEYNRELLQDDDLNNRYTRAAANIADWLEKGVLKRDETAAFYLHAHAFTIRGRNYLRRDIIAAVKLEEWDKKIVRPHEFRSSKSDR